MGIQIKKLKRPSKSSQPWQTLNSQDFNPSCRLRDGRRGTDKNKFDGFWKHLGKPNGSLNKWTLAEREHEQKKKVVDIEMRLATTKHRACATRAVIDALLCSQVEVVRRTPYKPLSCSETRFLKAVYFVPFLALLLQLEINFA